MSEQRTLNPAPEPDADDALAISQMLDDGCPNCEPDPVELYEHACLCTVCSTYSTLEYSTDETLLVCASGPASTIEWLSRRLQTTGRWLLEIFFSIAAATLATLLGG